MTHIPFILFILALIFGLGIFLGIIPIMGSRTDMDQGVYMNPSSPPKIGSSDLLEFLSSK